MKQHSSTTYLYEYISLIWNDIPGLGRVLLRTRKLTVHSGLVEIITLIILLGWSLQNTWVTIDHGWLVATEYLCHNWSRLVGRYRIPVSQLITVGWLLQNTCVTIDHGWLVATEYLCHNWSRLVGRYRIPVSQLITEMFPSSQSHSSHFPIHYLPTDIWHVGSCWLIFYFLCSVL